MLPAIVFILVLVRVSAVLFTAPILGSRVVPMRYRMVLACFLSLAMIPLAMDSNLPNSVGSLFNAVCSETVIGVTLGLGVMIMFVAAQAAASVIGQLSGLQLSAIQDEVLGESSPLSRLFGMISLAAFALIGGPELVLDALLGTLSHLPLGTALNSLDAIELIQQLLHQSFLLTLRGVGPAVAALMVSTISVGLISRSCPQLNTFGISLTSNQLVMYLSVFLTLGGCVWLFVDDLDSVIQMVLTRIQQIQVRQ